MTIKLGHLAKCYRDVSSTWTLMTNIRDATLADTMTEADVTSRASNGFRETEPCIRELSFEYDGLNRPAAELTAIQAAYNARTVIKLRVLDGPIATAGTRGVEASFKVFSNSRGEALEDAQMLSFVFKPCVPADGDVAPAEVTIAA